MSQRFWEALFGRNKNTFPFRMHVTGWWWWCWNIAPTWITTFVDVFFSPGASIMARLPMSNSTVYGRCGWSQEDHDLQVPREWILRGEGNLLKDRPLWDLQDESRGHWMGPILFCEIIIKQAANLWVILGKQFPLVTMAFLGEMVSYFAWPEIRGNDWNWALKMGLTTGNDEFPRGISLWNWGWAKRRDLRLLAKMVWMWGKDMQS